MKIIQNGIINIGEEPATHICRYCGCIYEYTKDDIKETFDRYDYFNYVNCPCCNKIYEWQVRRPS